MSNKILYQKYVEQQYTLRNNKSPKLVDCNIDYSSWYKLHKASIGQIMIAFSRIKKKSAKKLYEKILQKWFDENIPNLVREFEKLLKNTSSKDNDVRLYNLTGNLPRNVEINKKKHCVNLGRSNIGKLLSALKQRINFILNRETPFMYKQDEEYLNYFIGMKKDIKKFLTYVETFETNFVDIVDFAHKQSQKQYKIF